MQSHSNALARAKVNLTLHVGAAIAEGEFRGYHPVESLVVFADFGDALDFIPAKRASLRIDGPFGEGLSAGPDNLVMRSLALTHAGPHQVILSKSIPVSAGLGGGSANAAAVLRTFDPDGLVDDAALGADIPVCRLSQTTMMEGIGEKITPMTGLGQVPAVLANPGIAVSTGDIFRAFDADTHDVRPAQTARSGSMIGRALSGSNDLAPYAIDQCESIATLIDMLAEQDGCQLARMSGSGASVFALFESDAAADAAAAWLSSNIADVPNLWVSACRLGDPASELSGSV